MTAAVLETLSRCLLGLRCKRNRLLTGSGVEDTRGVEVSKGGNSTGEGDNARGFLWRLN